MNPYSDEFVKAAPKLRKVKTKEVREVSNDLPGIQGNEIVTPSVKSRGRPKKHVMKPVETANDEIGTSYSDDVDRPMTKMEKALSMHEVEKTKAILKLGEEARSKLKPDASNKEKLMKTYNKKIEAIEKHHAKLVEKLKSEKGAKMASKVKPTIKKEAVEKTLKVLEVMEKELSKPKKGKAEKPISKRAIDYKAVADVKRGKNAERKEKKSKIVEEAKTALENAKRELRVARSLKLKDIDNY